VDSGIALSLGGGRNLSSSRPDLGDRRRGRRVCVTDPAVGEAQTRAGRFDHLLKSAARMTMHVEQAAPQPIDRPLSALECYESRGWPNMLKANIEASEFPLSAPLPTAAWTSGITDPSRRCASPACAQSSRLWSGSWTGASPSCKRPCTSSPLKKEPPVGGPERMKEA
jgi:hypothetical protein